MRHDKQRPLFCPFPEIRMNVFLPGLNVNSMNRSVILLLNILFLSRRIDDVHLVTLQVEERVEIIGRYYASNQA